MFYKETCLVWYHELSERIEVTCHEEGVEPLLISQFLIYLYHHKRENGTIFDDSREGKKIFSTVSLEVYATTLYMITFQNRFL